MRIALLLPPMAILAACTPEGFEVTACSSDGQIAFRVHEIDGWIRDYQPRPDSVFVAETATVGGLQPKQVWNTRINDSTSAENRPARELIVYGETLPHWETFYRPQPLRRGVRYSVGVFDGGRAGGTDFVAGQQLPNC